MSRHGERWRVGQEVFGTLLIVGVVLAVLRWVVLTYPDTVVLAFKAAGGIIAGVVGLCVVIYALGWLVLDGRARVAAWVAYLRGGGDPA